MSLWQDPEMDPLPPPQPTIGTGVQQPHVPPLSTANDDPDGWQSGGWGPTIWLPSVFATSGNEIQVAPPAPPLDDPAEIHVEPGDGMALPEGRSTPVSQGEGTGDPPPGDVPSTDSGVSSDSRAPTKAEGLSCIPPMPGRGRFCDSCPDLPSFTSRNAFRKHRRQVHGPPVPQCPVCFARIAKQPLARHLEKVHGVTDPTVAADPLTIPVSIQTNGAVESFHTPNGAGGSRTNETSSGRVYCQEHDCGRGFSSQAHHESHMRFFHSMRPEQTAEVQNSSSTGATQGSAGQPPGSTSIVIPPYEGERLTQDNHDLRSSVEARVPNLSVGEPQDVSSRIENVGTRPTIPIESSPSTQAGVTAQLKPNSPTSNILSLHCRMCDSPPMVTSQPTVTTCGHLFCSECITGHVVSTSRCPVCNSTLLLYCLFKLDLPVVS